MHGVRIPAACDFWRIPSSPNAWDVVGSSLGPANPMKSTLKTFINSEWQTPRLLSYAVWLEPLLSAKFLRKTWRWPSGILKIIMVSSEDLEEFSEKSWKIGEGVMKIIEGSWRCLGESRRRLEADLYKSRRYLGVSMETWSHGVSWRHSDSFEVKDEWRSSWNSIVFNCYLRDLDYLQEMWILI